MFRHRRQIGVERQSVALRQQLVLDETRDGLLLKARGAEADAWESDSPDVATRAYEEALRIPLMIRYPARIAGGLRPGWKRRGERRLDLRACPVVPASVGVRRCERLADRPVPGSR